MLLRSMTDAEKAVDLLFQFVGPVLGANPIILSVFS